VVESSVSKDELDNSHATESPAIDGAERTVSLGSAYGVVQLIKNNHPYLVLFVCLQVALIISSAFLPSQQIEYLSCQAMFAIILAESALATSWLIFGPGSLSARILITPFWITLAASVGGVSTRPDVAFVVLLAIAISLSLPLGILLIAIKYWFRLYLAKSQQDSLSAAFQFEIIHWFVLTLCIAAILGLGRVATKNLTGGPSNDMRISAILGIAWTMTLLPSILVPLWNTSRTRLAWTIGASLALTAATATSAAYLLWHALPMLRSSRIFESTYLITIPLFACLVILGSLLVVREEGLRLMKRNPL
jgi:hypothetical protein